MNKWDKIYSEGGNFKPLNNIFLDRLLSEIEKISGQKPKTAIDLGCGTGDALIKLARHGLTVTGIDSSEVAINQTKELFKEQNHETSSIAVGDLETMTAAGIFNIVLCKLVYAFVENKEKFLKLVKESMGEKSFFILITPVLYENIKYSPSDKPGIAVSFKETNDLLNKLFSKVSIFDHDYFADKGDVVTFLLQK